jgi:hypothetical protein
MAYVYQHIRLDTNEVFYIGMGNAESGGKYTRANSKHKRNSHWKYIVNKAGYRVEILKNGMSWEAACKEEIRLIKQYGRKDLNEGNLVNLTNGGDGMIGLIRNNLTEESKQLIANSLKKYYANNRVSDETREKLRKSNKGTTPWNKGLTGIYTDEAKERMRTRKKNYISQPKLTKDEIAEAQSKASSNLEVARILNVSYKTYKKYIKIYGLSKLNPSPNPITHSFF